MDTENEKIYTEEEMEIVKNKYRKTISMYKDMIEISKRFTKSLNDINKILAQKNLLNEKVIEKQQSMINNLTQNNKTNAPREQEKTNTKCPLCNKENLIKSKRKNGENYYYCPECSTTYPEKEGKPDTTIEYCPECGELLKHFFSTKTKNICFYCEKCNTYYDDENGKPVQQ